MAVTLTVNAKLSISGSYKRTDDLDTATLPISFNHTLALTSGTGNDQADLWFSDTRSVTAASPDDIDIAGVLADIYGTTLTLARLKMLYIRNNDASNDLHVGGDVNSVPIFGAVADYIVIKPGGILYVEASDATAYPVTGGTGDILQVDASAGTVSYDIAFAGASA